tara:strand:+ start:741 stop:1001 length:261 start_codon:yes stop_codon:yes gene_type:complete
MPTKVYPELPSSVVEAIEIDTDNNTVSIIYKSNRKRYTYQSENASEFEQQLLAEFDQGIDTGYSDVSIGRFVNKNVNGGGLTLLTD